MFVNMYFNRAYFNRLLHSKADVKAPETNTEFSRK